MSLKNKLSQIKNINVDTLVQPYVLIPLVAVLVISFLFLLRSISFSSSSLIVAIGLYIMALASILPDRFRPLVSFSVAGMVTVLFAVAFGPTIGFLTGASLQLFYIVTAKAYKPIFVARTLTISPFVLGVIPTFLEIGANNIVEMTIFVIVLMILVAIPFWIMIPEIPIFKSVASAAFNIYWQYILLNLYGERIFLALMT